MVRSTYALTVATDSKAHITSPLVSMDSSGVPAYDGWQRVIALQRERGCKRQVMKLGILKTDAVRPEWVPEFGEYPDMFIALLGQADPDLEFAVYDVEQGQYPADIDEVDAYLITGSKSSVYEDKPWIATLMDFVRELDRSAKNWWESVSATSWSPRLWAAKPRNRPRAGAWVCTHTSSARAGWHDQGDWTLNILVSHQDQVVTAPQNADVLASSEFCENAVCQIGDHILTFQGHPEFVPDYSREIMTFRRKLIGEEVYAAGLASLSGNHEGERVAQWILNFLRSRARIHEGAG